MKTNKYNSPDDWLNFSAGPGCNSRQRGGGKDCSGVVRRVGIALLILIALLLLRELPHPAGEYVREQVRYLLTAEWDFRPLMGKAVEIAARIANWEDPALHGWPVEESKPTVAPGSLELVMPVSGQVVREFGWSVHPLDGMERYHPGIDIKAPIGTEVRAVLDGLVVRTGRDAALGEYVLLEHGNGLHTLYAGVSGITVTEGQQVMAGQVIARVSDDGDVAGGGLHFEMRENKELVDPLPWFGADLAPGSEVGE